MELQTFVYVAINLLLIAMITLLTALLVVITTYVICNTFLLISTLVPTNQVLVCLLLQNFPSDQLMYCQKKEIVEAHFKSRIKEVCCCCV